MIHNCRGQCLKGTALFFIVFLFLLVFGEPTKTIAMGDPFDPMYSQVTSTVTDSFGAVITENEPATESSSETVSEEEGSESTSRQSRKLVTFYDSLMYALGTILIILPTIIYLFLGLAKLSPVFNALLSKILLFCQAHLGEVSLVRLTVHCLIAGVVGTLFVTGIAKTIIARAWDFFYKLL